MLALSSESPQFSHLLNPRQSSATHAHDSPLTWPAAPGTRGVQPGDPVEDRRVLRLISGAGAEQTSLHVARGNGFSLLAFGVGPAVADMVAAEAEWLSEALAPESVTPVIVPSDDAPVLPADGLVVLDDADGGLAGALGAEPGEVFVVRPDGQLLARTSDVARVAAVAEHVRAGTAPEGAAAEDAAPAAPAEELARERVWLALASHLDTADGSGDRAAFLTRLAMLLGDRVGADTFDDCAAAAAACADPARA